MITRLFGDYKLITQKSWSIVIVIGMHDKEHTIWKKYLKEYVIHIYCTKIATSLFNKHECISW